MVAGRRTDGGIETMSLVMRAKGGPARCVSAIHNAGKLSGISSVECGPAGDQRDACFL